MGSKSFVQRGESLEIQARFADWRRINARALLYGKVEVKEDNRLRVEFRLLDVSAERQIIGKTYSASQSEDWGCVARMMADAVNAEFSSTEFKECLPENLMR